MLHFMVYCPLSGLLSGLVRRRRVGDLLLANNGGSEGHPYTPPPPDPSSYNKAL